MNYSRYLKYKKQNELNKIKTILQEAKIDRMLITESSKLSKRKNACISEINQSLKKIYSYSLIEREIKIARRLNEGLNYITDEDASVAFLLKNLRSETSTNEIGLYIDDNFNDLIKAVESLRNVEDLSQTKSSPSRFGGYGGGGSFGTAGIVREVFGRPPESGRRGISRYSGSSSLEFPKSSSEKKGMTLGSFMSPDELEHERHQNVSRDVEDSMKIMEKKLPEAVEFLNAFVDLFSDEDNVEVLSRPEKKTFFGFGSSSKEKLVKSAFQRFQGFDVKHFLRDINDNPQLVTRLASVASEMYPDVHKLSELESVVTGKLTKSIGSHLKDMFSLGGGAKASGGPLGRPR